MDHLTDDQIAELRIELDLQLAKLEKSMRLTDQALEPVQLDQTAVGRLSRIDSLQNQGLTRNLQEREQLMLAQLQGALRRMGDGSYGRCTSCADPIPFGRLFVVPESPTCAGCS